MNRFIILCFASTFAFAQPEKARREILIAQDVRDSRALSTFLSHKNPDVRSFAAFACGSVQDTLHAHLLVNLLSDKDYHVRTASAFALGQMNSVIDSARRASLSSALTKRLAIEQSRHVALRIVEALGKVGDEMSLNVLVAAGESSPYSGVRAEAALAVGRYAYRGIKNKTAVQFVADVIERNASDEAWKAAYAMMRVADSALLARYTSVLLRSASSADVHTRMFSAAALGKSGLTRDIVNTLLSLALQDSDWRVRVNSIKALAGVGRSLQARVIPVMLTLLADSSEHVSLTAASTLGTLDLSGSSFIPECRKGLVEVMNDPRYTQRQKREAAIALAKLAPIDAFPILSSQLNLAHLTRESFAAALGFIPTTESVQTLAGFTKHVNSTLHRLSLESIISAAKQAHKDSSLTLYAKPVLANAVMSKDVALVSNAASALADPAFADDQSASLLLRAMQLLKNLKDTEALTSVIQALGDLKASSAVAPLESELNNRDHTVAAEAAKALKKITTKSYDHLLKPHPKPAHVNWKLLESVRKNPTVRVQTTQGVFSFTMLPDESPFTCVNFAQLMRNNFFDSLLFHRVVPGFVIQGGDPRGDGWGGPGYAIRSEFGFEHYEPGMVGVASSGKDTEGCQWFVTHNHTPHLDGRYTIFGRIISGMDVVNRIQVGDRILKMAFTR